MQLRRRVGRLVNDGVNICCSSPPKIRIVQLIAIGEKIIGIFLKAESHSLSISVYAFCDLCRSAKTVLESRNHGRSETLLTAAISSSVLPLLRLKRAGESLCSPGNN